MVSRYYVQVNMHLHKLLEFRNIIEWVTRNFPVRHESYSDVVCSGYEHESSQDYQWPHTICILKNKQVLFIQLPTEKFFSWCLVIGSWIGKDIQDISCIFRNVRLQMAWLLKVKLTLSAFQFAGCRLVKQFEIPGFFPTNLRMFDCGIRVKNTIKINFITVVINYLHYKYNELYMLLICDIFRTWLGYVTEC